MSDLVFNFLKNAQPRKNQKQILPSRLTPNRKIVFLDRQVIKYFIDSDKYSSPEIVNFREKILEDYDKNSNIISIISAFYEGGSGISETGSKKRQNAIRDLKGIDDCFRYARVDESFVFKSMKKATHAFTLDSGVLQRDQKYEKIIKATYSYYKELLSVGFNGIEVIAVTKKLKKDMDALDVSVGDPIAQYCFSLLTNYQNARKIFKVKGLAKKSEEDIQRIAYNSYADLRVFMFMLEFKSRLPVRAEVCFVSNDKALNQFNEEFKNSVQHLLSKKDELQRISNLFNTDINFNVFNNAIFKKNELEEFKKLFFDWAD